jgi:hypothetical protein
VERDLDAPAGVNSMRLSALVGACCAVLFSSIATAADRWSVEAFGGDAFNFHNRLKISQDGGYARSLSADYSTRAFRSPPYYVLRGARWSDDAAWELSLVHHKLYLNNPPAGVESLSISHGFNIVSLNRAFRMRDWTYRFGAGPVITHAEATILGTKYDGPYKLSGLALLAGGGRRFYFGSSAFFSLEGMASAAYASPSLPGAPNARIKATNTAIHLLAGLGYEF